MCLKCGCQRRFRPRGPYRWREDSQDIIPLQTPIERFVEPCLLLLLRRAPAHGYGLKNDLERLDFSDGSVDVGNLYRTLRTMEEDGWIASEWERGSLGPQKRMYRPTPLGEKFLHSWAQGLRRSRDSIDSFLMQYQESFQKGGDKDV